MSSHKSPGGVHGTLLLKLVPAAPNQGGSGKCSECHGFTTSVARGELEFCTSCAGGTRPGGVGKCPGCNKGYTWTDGHYKRCDACEGTGHARATTTATTTTTTDTAATYGGYPLTVKPTNTTHDGYPLTVTLKPANTVRLGRGKTAAERR
jgi:hypothetical protein